MSDLEKLLNVKEAFHHAHDFKFDNGQHLEELKIRYLTAGTPRHDDDGHITNAVLLLHTTTSSADVWFQPSLAAQLFVPGEPLDARNYFLIAPDMIGFGGSSKPSDGMRASFPNYRYVDLVRSTHLLVGEGLGISHLRLVMGISMGGMLSWMWSEMFPDFMDAVVPISCQPGPMSGRNWIQRRINIEAIRNDPEWNGGDYETNPSRYVFTAPLGGLFTQSVTRIQKQAPTRQDADALYQRLVDRARHGDANDRLYQLEASMDYDPSSDLHKIKVPVLTINFVDDELNPPELGVVETALGLIENARSVLIPAGPDSIGHLTGQIASTWKSYLAEFMHSTGIAT